MTDAKMSSVLENVGRAFRIPGKLDKWSQIKVGNVNKTYKVTYLRENGSRKAYIVQNLNLFVFKHPQQVMHNIDLVTEHIRDENPGKICLHFHHTVTGENYYVDETGFWRLFNYVKSETFDACENLEILYDSGVAFGEFQNELKNFDASSLFVTIENFHNTPVRLRQLWADEKKDAAGRVSKVKAELEWLHSVEELAGKLQRMLENGELQLRVTHNDTKINNVLFDRTTHRALTVIDLDTVMPGLVGHDFGDAVRFACNYVEEDSRDADKAGIDMKKFEALTRGFLSAVELTANELDTLALSCFTLAAELASRFLNDYINGDQYFRVEYPEHNLVRARCQIALAKDMQKHMDEMDAIVKNCAKEPGNIMNSEH